MLDLKFYQQDLWFSFTFLKYSVMQKKNECHLYILRTHFLSLLHEKTNMEKENYEYSKCFMICCNCISICNITIFQYIYIYIYLYTTRYNFRIMTLYCICYVFSRYNGVFVMQAVFILHLY